MINIFKIKPTIENYGLKWGSITFLVLGAYFLIMKALGLVYVLELRMFNAVIMFTGCFLAIRESKANVESFNYFSGILTGMITAFIASSVFAIFGIIYLKFLNPDFMIALKENEPLGYYLTPLLASFQIFIEGAASGFTISFAIMQFLKKPWVLSAND